MSLEKIIKKIQKQSLKAVLDIILLSRSKNNLLSGYDAIDFIHKEYDILLSSGTVYSHMYSLEREGLLCSDYVQKTKVFSITEKGENVLEHILKENTNILTRLNETKIL